MAAMTRAREQALIRKAKAGDGDAIEGLIRAHQGSLFAFMLRMSGSPDVAEDMVQEAFVRVLRNLDRFDTRFRFSTWLFTIAKRLYVNYTQKHRPSYDSDTVGIWEGQESTPQRITAQEESMDNVRELLDRSIGSLNAHQREIVLLFHQQHWSIAEIADHLDMPEGTIKSHLHRARKRMKRFICSCQKMRQQVEEMLQ